MKIEKILKKLPESVVNEFDVMGEEQLRLAISQSEEAIDKAARERDENPHYQAAKTATADLSAGLKEVKSYQKAKVYYALLRLRELSGEAK